MQSTRLDPVPRRAREAASAKTGRIRRRSALGRCATLAALAALLACDGAAFPEDGPATLPITLDLRSSAEAARWRPGPAIANRRGGEAGLALEAISGSTAGRYVERALRVGEDRLGAVELEVASGARATHIEVVPIVAGRARTRQSVVARARPDDPQHLVARFRTGTWNRAPVDALRVVLGEGTDRITLARVRVTSERYAPLPPAPARPAARAGPDRPHVVLLVADTLRADRMSLYGAPRATTPILDGLAAQGTVFERAWSQAACTFPSVNALLTGTAATSFLGEPAHATRSLQGRGALAERLGRAGYATAAVSASWVVRATPSIHNDWGGGYDAGFDHFDESCAGEAAACVNGRALEWIDARDTASRPFFLYLHYLDPHDPYRPPPDHARRFAEPDFPDPRVRAGDPNGLADAPPGASKEAARRHLLDLYDEELAYLDGRIGRLFDALDQRGLLAGTIVVLASDHGEAFDEHGHWKHCSSVHEEQIRTPLVFWGPGVPRGRRSTATAENVDVLPTLLDLLGLAATPPARGEAVVGESLRPAMAAEATGTSLAHSSQGPWQSVTDGRHKWIEHVGRQAGDLYDLADDPQERDPLPLTSEATARIRGALAAAISERGEDAGVRDRAWTAIERELRALGYLE